VSWAARCGDHLERFTTLSVPVMTRLQLPERKVLDTLIEAGVAKSRSDALVWCVRLVAEHEETWIAELRTALDALAQTRARGPRGAWTGRSRGGMDR
jgi:Arc/MetJ-type ribon-helix-helix transcriptional regulator